MFAHKNLLLLQLHRLSATVDRPIATTGDNEFCAAFFTYIPLPYLIRHRYFTSSSGEYPFKYKKQSSFP
jgi:hypothetical protein